MSYLRTAIIGLLALATLLVGVLSASAQPKTGGRPK